MFATFLCSSLQSVSISRLGLFPSARRCSLICADEDSVISKENGQVVADSCELHIYLQNPSSFCDTLAAMKMKVTELSTPVQDGIDYYSDFDPDKEGYLRTNGLQKTKVFTWADMFSSNSERSSENYFNHITITLNQPYTDKAGNAIQNIFRTPMSSLRTSVPVSSTR